MISNFQLASDLRKGLEELGVVGRAQEMLVRETAAARHEWRVQEAIKAARAWVGERYRLEEHEVPDNQVALVLAVDEVGYGGPRDEGLATTRHPAFRRCGKGRKQASDGGAWSAAIRDARLRLAPVASFVARDGELLWNAGNGETGTTGLVPQPWFVAIAREGLRRAVGLPAAHSHDGLAWEGSADQWAQLLNVNLEEE